MLKKVNKNLKVPSHIGFIMDGNGRWATKRGLPRQVGYKHGVDALKRVVERCAEYNIKTVSVFGFSTENWGRPQAEIDEIFRLIRDLVDTDLQFFIDRGIRILHMGNRSRVPADVLKAVDEAIEKTKNCTACTLNIGFDYSGRNEIVNACNSLIKAGKKEVGEEDISSALQTASLGDLDIVVRTSGEQRISNFMLWQLSYAELYFTNVYWPSFGAKDVDKVIEFYNSRNRRFGKV